jgi:putative peptidoglycan lipid II flippase
MKLPFSSRNGVETTNRKILRAVIIVGVLSAVAKAGAMGKELIVAKVFGRGDALDAFLIAFLLPSFVLNLVMGALGAAFVPVFVETREKHGVDGAQKVFSNVLTLSVITLAVLCAILGVLAPYYVPLLGSSFSPDKLHLTRELLYWILPYVLFSGVATFVSSVLNTGESFALPAIVPVVTPLATICLLELAAPMLGIYCLSAGVLVGSVIEMAAVSSLLRRQGLSFRFSMTGLDHQVQTVLRQSAPMLAGTFLIGGTALVDQSMAAMLPSGSVAALSYGNRVVATLLAIGPTALSTASFPYFAAMAARQDWDGCRHTLKRYSVLVAAVTIPFTIGLMLFSQPLIRILFQRGAFTSEDVALVSRVQFCYAIQIPFYMCGALFVRFLSSIKRNDVLMYGAAMSLVLDVTFNLLFMRRWGVAGIALSTSLVQVFALSLLSGISIRIFANRQIVPATQARSGQAALER